MNIISLRTSHSYTSTAHGLNSASHVNSRYSIYSLGRQISIPKFPTLSAETGQGQSLPLNLTIFNKLKLFALEFNHVQAPRVASTDPAEQLTRVCGLVCGYNVFFCSLGFAKTYLFQPIYCMMLIWLSQTYMFVVLCCAGHCSRRGFFPLSVRRQPKRTYVYAHILSLMCS